MCNNKTCLSSAALLHRGNSSFLAHFSLPVIKIKHISNIVKRHVVILSILGHVSLRTLSVLSAMEFL